MALKGNLRDFTATQLFNLINLARKTGALTVTRNGTSARMYFREGKLIHASMAGGNGHLADILLKAGKITPEQCQVVLSRAQVKTDKELGLLLMSSGYATQEEILSAVREHMLQVVYQLFTWPEGEFRFDPNEQPPEDTITVRMDLENIILEGTRRIQELERLRDELPDLDNMTLQFTQQPRSQLRRINLTVDEWQVISYINPRNSIRQIARTCGMDDFQIRRIVYGLLHAGLVELVPVQREGVAARPAPRPVPARATEQPTLPPMPPPARPTRSLVRRIIDRILRL
ncbi:MAG: DUF4388 domain-containing protein [Anaerolineae bacterium]|nr:DUF4388 domain-containing protein [Anaerolineae bacterium]